MEQTQYPYIPGSRPSLLALTCSYNFNTWSFLKKGEKMSILHFKYVAKDLETENINTLLKEFSPKGTVREKGREEEKQ